MGRIGFRTMLRVGAVLLACAVIALAISVGRAWVNVSVRGEMELALADGRQVPARYEVRWGRFLRTPHLREPGLLDRLSTLRFAGRIETLEEPPLICEFETKGERIVVGSGPVPYSSDDTTSRRAAAEADYVSLPGHAVSLHWAELGRIRGFDQHTSYGGPPSIVGGWLVDEELLAITLRRLDPRRGWVPMGGAVARRR